MSQGVDYSPRDGAECPCCHVQSKTHKSTKVLPWFGATRQRYHVCSCGNAFKSVEVDYTLPLVSAAALAAEGCRG